MLIVVHERTAEGTPILLPSETVAFTVPAVTMVFGDADPVGVGSLFVTTERVVWLQDGVDKGYAIDIPSIGMHAVARDKESFDRPCLLCQLMTEDDIEEDEEAVASDPTLSTQVRYIPEDASTLDALFAAFSEAAALHPEFDEEDGVDDGFFTDYGGNGDVSTFLASEPCVIGKGIDVTDVGVPGETYEERRARVLAHLDGVLQVPDALAAEVEGQFDDADGDEDDIVDGEDVDGEGNEVVAEGKSGGDGDTAAK